MIVSKEEQVFIRTVRRYYRTHGRHTLPWRMTRNPYRILVSEIMLQQTQVSRVIEKYRLFLRTFPTVQKLADASLADVLKLWSGLGYNRRAKFLHALAREIVTNHRGTFPRTTVELETLPGIGPYTARAVAAFAYNIPDVFIETNIRSVYIHHFFPNKKAVSDKELIPSIKRTLDDKHPREWYWALMDYGSYLKSEGVRVHRKSHHYARQSRFEGSKREVRGMILRALTEGSYTKKQLSVRTKKDITRIEEVLGDLSREGLVTKQRQKFVLG